MLCALCVLVAGETPFASPQMTAVLLIEADLDARDRHEEALRAAGYEVCAIAACPDADDLSRAALVLSDIPSFNWLREQPGRGLPLTVVLTDDERAGVTACLCGAADWVPVDSDPAYLVDAVDGALR